MRGIIISVGNELLNGRTVNTNATEIARFLSLAGVKTIQVQTIPDQPEPMTTALKEALTAADVVVITGGLGPTHDDITKGVLAEYFRVPLVLNERVLERVEAHYRSRGFEMPQVTRNQAVLPANAQPLENNWGTAPGLYFFYKKKHIYALPGVPREMRGIFQNSIIPQLKSLNQGSQPRVVVFRTTGIPESRLYEELKGYLETHKHLEAAFLPRLEGVDLRIVVEEKAAAGVEKALTSRIGDYVFSREADVDVDEVLGRLLIESGLTISAAESCTGGLVQDRLTNVPGSSAYFLGGLVAYSNPLKMALLGVKNGDLEQFGAVSEAVAKQMAEGVRKATGSDLALATTGIAGPGGGSEQEPVGLVYIALASAEETRVKAFQFGHERRPNKVRSAQAALWMATQYLREKLSHNVKRT